MFYSFVLLTAAVMGGLVITSNQLWRFRMLLAWPVAALLIAATLLLLANLPGAVTVGIAIISLYSVLNIVRMVASRSPEAYVRRATSLTAEWLGLAHIGLAFLLLALWHWPQSGITQLTILAVVQLASAGVIVWSVRRQLKTTGLTAHPPAVADSQLPTITVAVPVRNEGHQLEACLTSVLASNYPKLEILAFDDSSSDDTPDIIKRFAHSGVRFIRSAKATEGWLAKNQAYERLAAEANGRYIVFCGADIRLAPQSLRQLVALAVNRHKQMVAVVPQNRLVTDVPLLQAMRYYWEMAPPRRLFRRPPVLSSLWMIEKRALEQAGGFAAARRSISPEAQLARYTARNGDGYSFVRSGPYLDITSEKPADQQQTTALLRRYPQLHRRPEMIMLLTAGQALLLLGPIAVIAATPLFAIPWPVAAIALLSMIGHGWAFGLIQQTAFPRVAAWRTYASLPLAVVADIWYLNLSMYRYEFGDVAWKDRNVSRPVMRIK